MGWTCDRHGVGMGQALNRHRLDMGWAWADRDGHIDGVDTGKTWDGHGTDIEQTEVGYRTDMRWAGDRHAVDMDKHGVAPRHEWTQGRHGINTG